MGSIQTAPQPSGPTLLGRKAAGSSVHAAAACDLCGGQQFEPIASRDRRGQELATAACRQCGLVAHQHIPSDEELVQFYAHEYRQQYHGETTPSARRLVRAWKNGERIYRQLASFVERGQQVFEVGAGIGATVKIFELHGCQATGVEPHEGFREFSLSQLHARLADGDLARLPMMPPQDLVLLVHVIEHLNAPTKALQCIHGLLKPGGRLYVECPNFGAPFARRSQLFHAAHIHNFTPLTLAMLAEKCGFVVERRFSSDDDPNLQMLLKRVETGRLNVDPDSFRRTMAALNRYNLLSYHLRRSYLATRFQKLCSYAVEHLLAYRLAQGILNQCQASASRSAPGTTTRR